MQWGNPIFLTSLRANDECTRFSRSDFADVHRPIRIECKNVLFLSLLHHFQDMIGQKMGMYLRLEQVVQEVYPRLYKMDGREAAQCHCLCCAIQSICVIAIHRRRTLFHSYIGV